MSQTATTLVILISLLVSIYCRIGVQLSSSARVTSAMVKCIISSGYGNIATSIQSDDACIDANDIQVLKTINKVGYHQADIVYFPCRGRTQNNAKGQVDQFMSKIGLAEFQRLWIFPMFSFTDQYCSWTIKTDGNCEILFNLLNEFKSRKVPVGIAAMQTIWQAAMDKCDKFASEKLFWFPEDSNEQPNFDDFQAFSGWTKPAMKSYIDDKQICNGKFSLYYEP